MTNCQSISVLNEKGWLEVAWLKCAVNVKYVWNYVNKTSLKILAAAACVLILNIMQSSPKCYVITHSMRTPPHSLSLSNTQTLRLTLNQVSIVLLLCPGYKNFLQTTTFSDNLGKHLEWGYSRKCFTHLLFAVFAFGVCLVSYKHVFMLIILAYLYHCDWDLVWIQVCDLTLNTYCCMDMMLYLLKLYGYAEYAAIYTVASVTSSKTYVTESMQVLNFKTLLLHSSYIPLKGSLFTAVSVFKCSKWV